MESEIRLSLRSQNPNSFQNGLEYETNSIHKKLKIYYRSQIDHQSSLFLEKQS